MKKKTIIGIILLSILPPLYLRLGWSNNSQLNLSNKDHIDSMTKEIQNLNPLTAWERHIIVDKGTEPPFTGELLEEKRAGLFLCKWCNAPLYHSDDKFDSGCGWPSFDQEIEGAVKRTMDRDGRRTEITCQRCGGHLGHLFEGEGFTARNTRHCVNSASLIFSAFEDNIQTAYFAAGCFWGVEHLLGQLDGVLKTQVGYMGGKTNNPTYEEVCRGESGHLETVEVHYNSKEISYESLVKAFFEIHDFTQRNGQGPDIGTQYLSAIFVANREEREVAQAIIDQLTSMNYRVATTIRERQKFFPAEDYHQAYYQRNGKHPYCHMRRPIFD